MNVLHIIDIAGIGSILSHYHSKFNKGNSTIFYHKKNNFSFTISRYYEGQSFIKFRNLLIKSIIESRYYDLIHVHSVEHLVPIFKLLGKKVVLHYHGSDIRMSNRSLDKKRIFSRSLADLILYNDKKVKSKIITFRNVKKRFLPNPIDTELFTRKICDKTGGISYISASLDKNKTKKAIKQIMNAKIIETDKIQVPYPLMPEIFSKYEKYIDIRITTEGETLEEFSTTALQALACRCKVYLNDKFITKFPNEHLPEKVIEKLNSYYSEISP